MFSEALDAYLDARATPLEPLLQENYEETYASLSSPQMIAGPVVGRLLRFLVAMTAPRLVVEIGTFTGYSALSMAAAMPADGRIDTLDIEPKHAEVAQRYFDCSPFGSRITLHPGPALETIDRLEGEFDFVFIDADKVNYLNYYEAVLPRLSTDGLIAADNTLWSGRVLDEGDDSEDTRAIKAFDERVRSDSRVTSVMLTVRDGVTLIRPNRA